MENTNILKLKFNFENTAFCRTHYTGKYNNKNYNIVIIHENYFDEILTASKDGEPSAPLKEGIKILLNNKYYTTKKLNKTTTIIIKDNQQPTKEIKIEVNNKRHLQFNFTKNGKKYGQYLQITVLDEKSNKEKELFINEGDLILLYNYYIYQKENKQPIF